MSILPGRIVRDHFRGFSGAEWIAFTLIPAAVGLAVGIFGTPPATDVHSALISVSGIVGAFLFGAFLQVAQRAVDWSDHAPGAGAMTSQMAEFLQTLAANAGYASLACIGTGAVFVVAALTDGLVQTLFTAFGAGLLTHVLMTLLLVARRIYAVVLASLNDARTRQPSE